MSIRAIPFFMFILTSCETRGRVEQRKIGTISNNNISKITFIAPNRIAKEYDDWSYMLAFVNPSNKPINYIGIFELYDSANNIVVSKKLNSANFIESSWNKNSADTAWLVSRLNQLQPGKTYTMSFQNTDEVEIGLEVVLFYITH